MWPVSSSPVDGSSDVLLEGEEEEVQDYRVKCLNNLAAAQLKLEQYDDALHTSRDVLSLDPQNVKALFRTGKVRDTLTLPLLHKSTVPGWKGNSILKPYSDILDGCKDLLPFNMYYLNMCSIQLKDDC